MEGFMTIEKISCVCVCVCVFYVSSVSTEVGFQKLKWILPQVNILTAGAKLTRLIRNCLHYVLFQFYDLFLHVIVLWIVFISHRWRISAAILFLNLFLKNSSSPERLYRLRRNFTSTFPVRSSFKFVNFFLIGHMVWRPSWKNLKTFKDLLLQKRWSDDGEISQLYSGHVGDISLLISNW